MVGFVLVSHSGRLAEGARELGLMMAPDVPVFAAGGMEDGGPGTDYGKICSAVTDALEAAPEGVIVIADMGSSFMTAEMVIEDLGDSRVVIADCPFAEGTVASVVAAAGGASLSEALQAAEEMRGTTKR
ncbi:MAG: dihydroxyacetone kinase [Lachnospiraceae bacterium]|nr:dihydroxyacetone kinase [Lachnospiraceae bacterium]